MTMNRRVRNAFQDELAKLGGQRKKKTLEDVVHHPITQAVGYGSLAGEGAHALAHSGYFGKKLSRLAGSKTGSRLGAANLALASAFLGAEGAAALSSYLRKRPKKQ
jgi:hypothetical protein